MLNQIETITQARDLKHLPKALDALRSPAYRHLTHIRSWDTTQPGKPALRRKPFHSPFADLYLNLKNPLERQTLLSALAKEIKSPISRMGLRNSLEELTNIYFYALRPGIQTASTQEQNKMLGHFETILKDTKASLLSRRLLQTELRIGLLELGDDLHRTETQQQLQPLLSFPLPDEPIQSPAHPAAERLKTLLKAGNITELRRWSASGQLSAIIPEWKLLEGPDHYQHATHDYTLDEHTFQVIEATRRSSWFKQLNPAEQFIVTLAALIHDIDKRTGPKNLYEADRTSADKYHPIRCAEIARLILPTLDLTPEEREDVEMLVRHHQDIGDMINPYGVISEAKLEALATTLGSEPRLAMLTALTEGDIRSVRKDTPKRTWFTPEVAQKLQTTYQDLRARILQQKK